MVVVPHDDDDDASLVREPEQRWRSLAAEVLRRGKFWDCRLVVSLHLRPGLLTIRVGLSQWWL